MEDVLPVVDGERPSLSDGMAITCNLEHDHAKKSVFAVVDPSSMTQVQKFEFVGASVGRFSIDPQGDQDHVYATTPTHIHRLIYNDGELALDPDWSASYRVPGEDQGFAWCNSIGDDSVWFMDMGDNEILKQVMAATPVGGEPLDLSEGIYTYRAPCGPVADTAEQLRARVRAHEGHNSVVVITTMSTVSNLEHEMEDCDPPAPEVVVCSIGTALPVERGRTWDVS